MRVRSVLLAFASALLILVASGCSGSNETTTPESAGRVLVEPSESESTEGSVADETAGDDRTETDDGDDAPGAIAFDADAAEETGASADGDATNDTPVGDDDTAGEPDASTNNEPIPDTPLARLTTELISFVEDERGHTFTSRPEIELLDSDAFGAAWSELIANDAATYRDDYVNFTDIYRAMGVIDGDRTLEEIWTRFGDAGVIGFYDPSTGNIKLRSGEISAFTRTVLVHELVHALEDQVFDLDRTEYDTRTDEIDWTFSALVEGSARVIEGRYRDGFTAAEIAEENNARQALPRTVSLSEFTPSFLELQFGRYRYGESFADALWAEGQGVIDAAFVDPPATSELILDAEAYLRGTPADADVPAPPADEAIFASGVWGEAGWAAVLTDSFDREEALEFADGWGGDSFVAWRTAAGTCVRSHILADTADELDEYANALEAWAQQKSGREIFYPTADIVRVTACG